MLVIFALPGLLAAAVILILVAVFMLVAIVSIVAPIVKWLVDRFTMSK